MSKFKSFSRRLSLTILLVVAIVFIVALGVAAISSHTLLAEASETSARHLLHATINEIEIPLHQVEVATKASAGAALYIIDSKEQLQGITCTLVSGAPMISGCAVAFPKDNRWGEPYAPYCYRDSASHGIKTKNLAEGGHDYTSEEWFEVPYRTKQPHWSSPYYDENGGGVLMTTYSEPILDPAGNVLAIFTADVPIDWMRKKVDKIRPYPSSHTSITCANGQVIGTLSDELRTFLEKEIKTNKRLQEIAENMRKGEDSLERFPVGPMMFFIAYGHLHNGWNLSITCPYNEVLEQSSRMHFIIAMIALVGLLVLFLICYATIKRLTRPIKDLSVAALSMAGGNLQTQLPDIKSKDEMMQLRDAFAYMQESLGDYIEELKTTTAANNRMEGELNVARDIQLGMLTHEFPDNIHGLLTPAKEVGGDLYDFIFHDNYLYFAVGDVSGKGAPAALMMAITRAALRFVGNLGLPLDEAMGRINNAITETNSNAMFVTLFIATLNRATGEVTYCNAGHNPIVVIPPDGEAYFLKAKPNLATGLFAGFEYEAEQLTIIPGTRLLLYTDGVSEAEREDKEQFGDARLLTWANNSLAHDPNATEQQVVDDLMKTVHDFTQGAVQNDDITILSIKY